MFNMAESLNAFERCCRLCAEEQEVTILLFSAEAEAMLLRNKLNKYLLIEVDEDDKLPKNVCIQCCTKLQTVCEFIDKARKAQEELQNRSITLEQISVMNDLTCIKSEIKTEPNSDDENFTPMEVSLDPMMVLQNNEGGIPSNDENSQSAELDNITYLHGVDGEDVTIKLIKRGNATTNSENNDEKSDVLKPFPCLICKRSFYTELALKNHAWIHNNDEKQTSKEYKCNSCGAQFDYKNEFMLHVKKHRISGLCQVCGRVFRTEKNLALHMENHIMADKKSYTCRVCGRSYNTKSNLKTHSITHSSERPYQCQYCKKSFKRNQDLKFHINQHTGAKPYKCPFCDKSFASSGNCYSHRNRMHPGRVEGKVRKRVTAVPSRENQPNQARIAIAKNNYPAMKTILKYQCTLCDHRFLKRDNFMYHMYQHTGQKPFKCSFCTEEFVTRKGLLLHHEKEHPEKDRPLALLSKNALLR